MLPLRTLNFPLFQRNPVDKHARLIPSSSAHLSQLSVSSLHVCLPILVLLQFSRRALPNISPATKLINARLFFSFGF